MDKSKSEIIKEMERNVSEMKNLVTNQAFNVGDAERYMERYFNILRLVEDVLASREKWKTKYYELLAQLEAKEREVKE